MSEGVILKSHVTKQDGRFEFKDLDAGAYTLYVSRDGYEAEENTVNVYAGETAPVAIVLQESKAEAAQPTGIKGSVKARYQLGWDNNSYLTSVRRASVKLYGSSILLHSAAADYAGNFEFAGLGAGAYTVAVQKQGYIKVEETVSVAAGKFSEIAVVLNEE
ncbi:MAG: carboxypeptidase regulatory-like domain-containing protein [Prevotellaceae bacterium]|nr:carboxypeptidase regulatory-like domain-containing protein [Prevotellaceae bacterium]